MIVKNKKEESVFFNKIDIEDVGIAGHSQGGVAAIKAVTEFDNREGFSSFYITSATWIDLAVGLKWNYDVKKYPFRISLSQELDRWILKRYHRSMQ